MPPRSGILRVPRRRIADFGLLSQISAVSVRVDTDNDAGLPHHPSPRLTPVRVCLGLRWQMQWRQDWYGRKE